MSDPAHILIVDDDVNLRKTLSDILETKGYVPFACETGMEALERVGREEIIVALVDLRLADISGLEVVRGIRQRSPQTECILLTGHASQSTAIEAVNLGAYSYYQKPYDIDQLLLSIRHAVEKCQAGKALTESQRRLATLMSNMPGMAYRCQNDPSWTMEFISEGCYPLTGYQPKDLLANASTSYTAIIHPADRQMVWAVIEAELKKKQPYQLNYRIVTACGEEKWVWEQGQGVYDPDGNLLALEGFITDITARKRAEEALRHSQKETIHVNRLLLALSHAAQAVQRAHTTEDVYRAIQNQITQLGYFATGFEFSEDGQSLHISYLNFKPNLVHTAEKMTGLSPRNFHFSPVAGSIYYRVIVNSETIFIEDAASAVADTLPKKLRALARPMMDLLKLNQCIFTPLKVGEDVIGILVVTGPDLSATDNPAIAAFANQAAIAVQNARLFEQNSREITERKQAEDALRKSEENYRSLFENIPDGVYRTSLDGKFLAANPAFVNMFGYESEAELKQISAYDLYLDPKDRDSFLDQAQTSYEVRNMEMRMRRKDGQQIHGLDNARALLAPDGTILCIEGTLTDITARKRAEESLRLQGAALENAANAIMITDRIGIIQWINPACSALTGYTAQEALGQTPRILRSGVQDGSFYEKLWDTILSGRVWQSELVNKRKDGSLYSEDETITPVRGERGEITHFISIKQDITARKQAEELTRRRVAELEVLYESSLTISRLLNPRDIAQTTVETLSQKLEWHHAAVRLYRPESNSVELLALHQPNTAFENISGEIERLQKTIRFSGVGLSGWVIEHGETVLCADVNADPRYIQTYPDVRSGLYVPMKLGERVLGCISVESTLPAAFDEYDQRLLSTMAAQAAIAIQQAQLYEQVQQYAAELEKRVEARTADLQHANLELARAARMKDEFLASMSHELRTPLTGILGLSESMQLNTYGELSGKQLKILKMIEDSGRHLLELINDILDLSKIEAGKFDLQIEPCSLAGMCQASLQMTKGMAQQKHQQTSFSINPDSIIVRADARRLKQMLVNLLSNAVKFTPESGRLGIEVQGSQREQLVMITVWDTGIGIQNEDFPRLFQPFVQLDSSLSRQYAGTGLGLSLVQRMAALHGGRIEVESIPGAGSRFTLILPWETEAAQAEVSNDKILAGLHRVLTIDENEVNAELLTRHLKNLGMSNQVQPVARGAVEQAAQTAPDAILIHLNLPDKSGLDLLVELKADERTRNIPVIIMSVDEKRSESMALGAAGYLVKPFSQTDLRAELQRVTALTSKPETVPQTAPVVLLADDNEIILEVVADFLRTRNFQVGTVNSGGELLARVEEIHPDILLIDIQMPGMDGLEAMRRIRAHADARISALPMIAVTALAMSGDRERCVAAGANEYLSKPLHLEKLVEIIQEFCKK